MKDIGIIRRIDELGRIVIPKEMRKRLNMVEGESIAFYLEDDSLILKKFSDLEGMSSIIESVIGYLYEKIGCSLFISDNERILYTSQDIMNVYQGKKLNQFYKMNIMSQDTYHSLEIINDRKEKEVFVYPFYREGKKIGSLGILIKKSSYHIIDKTLLKFCIEIIERELLLCV